MLVSEILETGAKRSLVTGFALSFPLAHNYCDVLQMMSDDEWSQYRIFSAFDPAGDVVGIGGLSPEGNFNVYASTRDVQLALIERLLIATNGALPKLLFGTKSLESAFPAIPAFSPVRLKMHPFLYMKRAHPLAFIGTAVPMLQWGRVKPTAEQLSLVQEWYCRFNEEQGSSWRSPEMEEIRSKELYFLTDEGGALKAACANTLASTERFWIGRLWVPREARGKGIGRAMMARLAERARELGKPIALHVFTSNRPAVALYLSLGFGIVGENAYWTIETPSPG